jgi:hypothetical protein
MPNFSKRLPGLLAPILAFWLAGCEKAVPRTDYFPLRDGNRWSYRLLDRPMLQRLAEGQQIITAPPEELAEAAENGSAGLPAKAEIVMDAFGTAQPRSAGPAVAREVTLELRSQVDDLTYRTLYDTKEQVWSKRSGYVGFQSSNGRSYLLILPPHSGYKWVVTSAGGQNLYYQIETANATLSTPKEEFDNCVLVRQESRDRKEIFRYWFAPDVGLVRRSKYFMNEEVFRQELLDYKVLPATPATRLAEEQEVHKACQGSHRGSEFRNNSPDQLRDSRLTGMPLQEVPAGPIEPKSEPK